MNHSFKERFFAQFTEETTQIQLLDEEFHHLKVLRIQEGEEVEVVNGNGLLARCKISNNLIKVLYINIAKPKNPLILVQGINKQADLVVEKATELGATEIIFFKADRSEKKTISLERLNKIAISAIKQCKSLFLPKIEFFSSLSAYTFKTPSFFGSLDSASPPLTSKAPATIVIGPERGFSDKELLFLNKCSKPVKLNSNILRSETAAITAIALLSIIE